MLVAPYRARREADEKSTCSKEEYAAVRALDAEHRSRLAGEKSELDSIIYTMLAPTLEALKEADEVRAAAQAQADKEYFGDGHHDWNYNGYGAAVLADFSEQLHWLNKAYTNAAKELRDTQPGVFGVVDGPYFSTFEACVEYLKVNQRSFPYRISVHGLDKPSVVSSEWVCADEAGWSAGTWVNMQTGTKKTWPQLSANADVTDAAIT